MSGERKTIRPRKGSAARWWYDLMAKHENDATGIILADENGPVIPAPKSLKPWRYTVTHRDKTKDEPT